jgi:hypothetical protein
MNASSSGIAVFIYQNTWRHIPEYNKLEQYEFYVFLFIIK